VTITADRNTSVASAFEMISQKSPAFAICASIVARGKGMIIVQAPVEGGVRALGLN
jgi:hypothetical protein